ncbi:MAG: TlyA family rRNA (cytidine-2'-O)-methyltransferase [Clostridia bacterium]|nr:TlyA family rRNA (cytidine-2'-O)-methyltransferase [Clostridia bacterium]
MKAKKQKAIDIALSNALFDDRKAAEAAFLAGEVTWEGKRLKAGDMLNPDECSLHIHRAIPYAGKGGFKLQGALDDFDICVAGLTCIDAGASTGGFTDCLIQNGASLVYAVDVGFGQLAGSLRQNNRVLNLERTNISDAKLRALSPTPVLATVDLSYLSLRKAIPQFAEILHEQGEMLCLVKPLFEIDDAGARRSGIIPEDAYAPLLEALIRDINHLPYAAVRDVTHSHVTGNAGTREFFLHVCLGHEKNDPLLLSDKIPSVIERARLLEEYRK